MRNSRSLQFVTLSLFMIFALPGTAHAYLDPGTGSMLVQSLLAAVAAALVFGRNAWRSLTGAFKRLAARSRGTRGDPGG